jgi:hypothetical protein
MARTSDFLRFISRAGSRPLWESIGSRMVGVLDAVAHRNLYHISRPSSPTHLDPPLRRPSTGRTWGRVRPDPENSRPDTSPSRWPMVIADTVRAACVREPPRDLYLLPLSPPHPPPALTSEAADQATPSAADHRQRRRDDLRYPGCHRSPYPRRDGPFVRVIRLFGSFDLPAPVTNRPVRFHTEFILDFDPSVRGRRKS